MRWESMLQWEEVGLLRLVVECLSQSTTRNDPVTKPDLYRDLGVEENWVCQAHPMQVHIVYQRDGRERVPGEQGLSWALGCAFTRRTVSGARIRQPGSGSRPMPASMTKGDTGNGGSPSSTLLTPLCTAQGLTAFKAELEAADPQVWPSIKDLHGRYRPEGEGAC